MRTPETQDTSFPLPTYGHLFQGLSTSEIPSVSASFHQKAADSGKEKNSRERRSERGAEALEVRSDQFSANTMGVGINNIMTGGERAWGVNPHRPVYPRFDEKRVAASPFAE